jgi:hypothetical protein
VRIDTPEAARWVSAVAEADLVAVAVPLAVDMAVAEVSEAVVVGLVAATLPVVATTLVAAASNPAQDLQPNRILSLITPRPEPNEVRLST